MVGYVRNQAVQAFGCEKHQVLEDQHESQANSEDVEKLTVVTIWKLGLEVFFISRGKSIFMSNIIITICNNNNNIT